MFRRFYIQKVICSENICSKGSMFRRFYIQKVLCSEGSMFRRSYIQKVLCSKKIVQKVLYSEGSMFRRSYIQIYSEGPIFRKLFVLCSKNIHLSVSTCKLQCKITNHRLSFELIRSDELLSWRVVRRLFVHNLPKSLLGLQST